MHKTYNFTPSGNFVPLELPPPVGVFARLLLPQYRITATATGETEVGAIASTIESPFARGYGHQQLVTGTEKSVTCSIKWRFTPFYASQEGKPFYASSLQNLSPYVQNALDVSLWPKYYC